MAVTMEQAKANFKEAKRQFYNTQIKELFKDGYEGKGYLRYNRMCDQCRNGEKHHRL